jgi:hypothetical protein
LGQKLEKIADYFQMGPRTDGMMLRGADLKRFTVYFTLDTNNEKISGLGQSISPGALSGWSLYGIKPESE